MKSTYQNIAKQVFLFGVLFSLSARADTLPLLVKTATSALISTPSYVVAECKVYENLVSTTLTFSSGTVITDSKLLRILPADVLCLRTFINKAGAGPLKVRAQTVADTPVLKYVGYDEYRAMPSAEVLLYESTAAEVKENNSEAARELKTVLDEECGN